MRKNKLLHLLAALEKNEIRKFGDRLRLWAQNKNSQLPDLYIFLAANRNKYQASDYQEFKQAANDSLFPDEPFNRTRLRNLMSDLYLLLEDFLAKEELQNHSFMRELLLRYSFQRHHLDSFTASSIEKSNKLLEENTKRDRVFHYQKLQLEHQSYYNTDHEHYLDKKPLERLLDIDYHLDCHYLINKLAYGCAILSTQLIRGSAVDIDFIDEVTAYGKKKKFKASVAIQIYLELFGLLKEPKEKGYYLLKEKLFATLQVFSKDNLLSLLVLLINICWFACPQDRRTREVFELYMKGVGAGILLEEGKISGPNFNNIVDAGYSLGEFKRVRQFIAEYLPYLEISDKRKNVQKLYEAIGFFREGKFTDALQVLNFLEFADFSYGLRAHSLQLQIIYEVKKNKGYKDIDRSTNAFKQYIQRKYKQHFISKTVREEYLNFLKIIKDLPFATSSRFSKVTKDRLRKKLLAFEKVHNRDWLLQKIEEIE